MENMVKPSGSDIVQMKVSLAEGVKVNHLLEMLMPSCEIVSLQEIIPSINEIFISLC